MSDKNRGTGKRLTASVVIIFLLALCLAITSYALVYSMMEVEDNIFLTGQVKINLNDGLPVIRDNEFLFEPGMTVKKEFFVQNESTCDVYYRLYFQNVNGGLADVLQIKICDGDRVLYSGTPNGLNGQVKAADDLLKINEKRELQIYFHFPQGAGNGAQQQYLSFDFTAEAVQTKNNPNKEF